MDGWLPKFLDYGTTRKETHLCQQLGQPLCGSYAGKFKPYRAA